MEAVSSCQAVTCKHPHSSTQAADGADGQSDATNSTVRTGQVGQCHASLYSSTKLLLHTDRSRHVGDVQQSV